MTVQYFSLDDHKFTFRIEFSVALKSKPFPPATIFTATNSLKPDICAEYEGENEENHENNTSRCQ